MYGIKSKARKIITEAKQNVSKDVMESWRTLTGVEYGARLKAMMEVLKRMERQKDEKGIKKVWEIMIGNELDLAVSERAGVMSRIVMEMTKKGEHKKIRELNVKRSKETCEESPQIDLSRAVDETIENEDVDTLRALLDLGGRMCGKGNVMEKAWRWLDKALKVESEYMFMVLVEELEIKLDSNEAREFLWDRIFERDFEEILPHLLEGKGKKEISSAAYRACNLKAFGCLRWILENKELSHGAAENCLTAWLRESHLDREAVLDTKEEEDLLKEVISILLKRLKKEVGKGERWRSMEEAILEVESPMSLSRSHQLGILSLMECEDDAKRKGELGRKVIGEMVAWQRDISKIESFGMELLDAGADLGGFDGEWFVKIEPHLNVEERRFLIESFLSKYDHILMNEDICEDKGKVVIKKRL